MGASLRGLSRENPDFFGLHNRLRQFRYLAAFERIEYGRDGAIDHVSYRRSDPVVSRRRFEGSVNTLQRMGIRAMNVAALEQELERAGWEPMDLGLTVPCK